MTQYVNSIPVCDGVITVDGVQITMDLIVSFLRNPPTGKLFTFERQGDVMRVKEFSDAEAAAKFFADQKKRWRVCARWNFEGLGLVEVTDTVSRHDDEDSAEKAAILLRKEGKPFFGGPPEIPLSVWVEPPFLDPGD